MRIPSGKTDQLIFFVAVDSTDLKTRKTGLTSFTVYRSRNGGTATVYTTPTVAELSAANMPGVYSLTVDEDTTIASTSDSEEYCVHITQASMAPVTRTIELYRRDTTSGNTALVDSSGRVDVIKIAGTTQTARDIGASVLLSTGTGTGQLDFTSGIVKSNVTQLLGTAWLTPGTAGTPDVNVKLWNALTTVELPLVPTTAGRKLDVSAGGEAGVDWANVGSQSTSVNLSATTTNLVNTATTVTNQLTAAAIATGIWQDATAGDFTTASSIGKSLYTAGVVPGGNGGLFIAGTNAATSITTALTANIIGNVTGNLSGSVGSVTGLTASNLDTTVSSRMATYVQPTGFLAATFPSGTIANTTNITAGTITTTTNLTNAPTAGDFTATMKTSLNAATPAVTVSDKTGFSLTSAYDAAKTASQAGDIMKVSSGTGANQVSLSSGQVTVGTIDATASKIKKNTAFPKFSFTMTDSSTGDEKTGLTVTGTVAINGGSFGALTNSVTEMANGWYYVDLAAADVNGSNIALRFTAAGATTRDMLIITQP